MLVHVLGSAAGGGFPQWNCSCKNCAGLRSGTLEARARAQSSIAVSADGEGWLLVNASPDVRTQINASPVLAPGRERRGTAIRAVLLVDAQIDHTAGLLVLREGEPLEIYCTEAAHRDLTAGFPVFGLLSHYCGANWRRVPIDGSAFEVPGVAGLDLTAVPLSGKAPPYSPHRHDPHPGDNIGLLVEDRDSGRTLFYAPGLASVDARLAGVMAAADCLLVDGTFWSEDEMRERAVGEKRASDMGHLPQSGAGGMIEVLGALSGPRKILIHVNNTNPILVETSAERAALEAAGIETAFDGMEIRL